MIWYLDFRMEKCSNTGGGSRVLGAADDSFRDLIDRGMISVAMIGVIVSRPAAAPEASSGMLLN